jgi:hypothetical protein
VPSSEPSSSPEVSIGFRERIALTWGITWPLLVIDVLWTLLLHAFVEGDTSTAETGFQIASLFLVGPMVLRRAFRLGTREHTIAVMKYRQEAPMSIGDALSVFWLLAWRSLILALLALAPLSLLLKFVVTAGMNEWVRGLAASPITNALGLTAVDGIMNMAFVPFLIPAMLRKRYRQFALVLRARPNAPQMKSVSPKHKKRNLSKR